ncbi:MAG: NUDIX hydrolase [Alphaproteobacteria bacterium]
MGSTPDTGPTTRMVPEGDDRPRMVCTRCGFIHYENPKIIVGAVCCWGDSYLLCRRAIEPRRGFWTMPAGFMELAETPEEGAAREVWEEAGARVAIGALLAVFSMPHINHVQLIYRAQMRTPEYSAGTESLEVGLFRWGEIPWDDLAYPSVERALCHHRDLVGCADFAPRSMSDSPQSVR